MRNVPHFRRILQFVLVTIGLLVGTQQGHATWNKLSFRDPNGYPIRVVRFLDPQYGWCAGSGQSGIWRTTDGGLSWNGSKLSQIVGATQLDSSSVTEILMLDRLKGYATLENDATQGRCCALYKTSDGGATWQPSALLDGASDIAVTSAAIVLTDRGGNLTFNGFISTDGGATFQRTMRKQTNGLAFVDNLHGVATGFLGAQWLYTTDGGMTWQPTLGADTTECWSVFGEAGTPNFFTAAENRATDKISITTIRVSTDYGASWSKYSNLPMCTTGHIGGAKGLLYVQTTSDADTTGVLEKGLMRSRDGGRTWIDIGGKRGKKDSRFAVVGCRGEIVIVPDDKGYLWKTTDGGDGAFPQFQVHNTVMAFDSLSACAPADTTIQFQNFGCDTLFLSSADIPTDSSVLILDASGAPAKFPYTIPPGGSSQLRLFVQSAGSSISVQTVIHLLRSGVETLVPITVTAPIKIVDPRPLVTALTFDSVKLCASFDSIITITNTFCRPITLKSVSLVTGVSFALVAPPSNVLLGVGQSVKVKVRYMPQSLVPANDVISVVVNSQNRDWSHPLSINGIPAPDNSAFVMSISKPFIFDTITRCDAPVKIPFTFTNPGCTNIRITTLGLLDTNKKPQVGTVFSGQFQFSDTLKNSDTLHEALIASPTTLGFHDGYVQITYNLQNQPSHTILVYYSVFIKRGSVILDVNTKKQSYDTILFCEQKRLTIPVKNSGCDVMKITNRYVQGLGFSIANNVTLPLTIPPGQTHDVQIDYIPNVSGISSGTLHIESDADTTAPFQNKAIVPLEGYATPTDTLSFSAATPKLTVKPGDSAQIYITPSRTIKNKGLKKLALTVQYNGDVLTFARASESTSIPNSTIFVSPEFRVGGKTTVVTITITGANLALDSTKPLASMWFNVTVSDSNKTSFTISDFAMNDRDPNFGKCALGAVSDTGTVALQFLCGDDILYRFMRDGKNFGIVDGIAPIHHNPYPNPYDRRSSGSLHLPFSALRSVTAHLDVVSEDGTLVYSDEKTSTIGVSSFDLSPAFASGTYHYRITAVGGSGNSAATGEFVVAK